MISTPVLLGRPLDASSVGARSDALFYVTTVMVAVLFVVMCGILLWACLRHRPGRQQPRYERGLDKRHLVYTAIITSVIFFGVDGTLLFDSYLDLDRAFWRFPTREQHPLELEVYAQQWSWNIRYAGPDEQFGTADDIVLLDELHVPVDRPVLVKMKSKDVVHSFYLPNFRIKQDVLPGTITRLWFEARRPGVYELGCAQHCGVSHYKMRGLVTVESADDFARWLRAAADDAARRYDPDDNAAHWGWPWDI
jgi:cytochrome c oxidase subunit 2